MILVAGATGALGGIVARSLIEQGHAVRILVRPGSDFQSLVDAGADPVFADLKDPASLAPACRGVEVVITTANSARRGGPDTVESVEVHGNANLIDAAKAAGVRQFIFVSAMGAAEDSPVPFMRGKALAERHLRESGLAYTILEPNLFLEVWAALFVAAPVAAGQPVTLVGSGSRRHSMISQDDVARFVVACVDHAAAVNRTIPLGGPAAISWLDVVAAFERAAGRGIEVRNVKPGTDLPGVPATVSQLAAALDGYDSPVPMEETARTFGVQPTSIDEYAARALGRETAAPGRA